jgi:hypothetical protein
LAPISTITRTSVVLTWNEAGGKALDYKAVKSTSPILTCEISDARTIKANSRSDSLPQFTTTFTDLLPETLYYFRVCSVDRDGNISSGMQITATTDERVKVTGILVDTAIDPILVKGESMTITVTFSDVLENVDSNTLLKLNLKNTSVYATTSSIDGDEVTFTYTADYGDYHPTAADSITVDSIIGSAEASDSTDVNLEILATATFKSFSGVQIITCPSTADFKTLHVPRNPIFGDYNFCVFKYEATDDGGEAESYATGGPWVDILASEAEDACGTTVYNDDNLSLISNNEWMTIARNIENNSSQNSFTGADELTYFYRGHTDNTDSTGASGTSLSADLVNPYELTGNDSSNGKDQRRTLHLSNGEVIWDFSGNVAEWVEIDLLPECSLGDFGISNCPDSGPLDLSLEYLGKIINSSTDSDVLARGGDFNDGITGVFDAGIYAMLFLDDNDNDSDIGFRCVLRPNSER